MKADPSLTLHNSFHMLDTECELPTGEALLGDKEHTIMSQDEQVAICEALLH